MYTDAGGPENIRRAVALLDRIFENDPEYPEAAYLYGRIMAGGDRPAEAEKRLRQAIRRYGRMAKLRTALVELLVRQGRPADAVREVQKARERLPNNKELREMETRLGAGQATP
ncbi:MAG: tetratricopeptide repeat protein [Planctomycetota bacterium]